VGSDTPASAAIAARVVFRTATPFELLSKFSEFCTVHGTVLFLLHRTAIEATLKRL
jgi:hypothetical protein